MKNLPLANTKEMEVEDRKKKVKHTYDILNKNGGGKIDSLGQYGFSGYLLPSSTSALFGMILEYLSQKANLLHSSFCRSWLWRRLCSLFCTCLGL